MQSLQGALLDTAKRLHGKLGYIEFIDQAMHGNECPRLGGSRIETLADESDLKSPQTSIAS
jgi:hypothetical protein